MNCTNIIRLNPIQVTNLVEDYLIPMEDDNDCLRLIKLYIKSLPYKEQAIVVLMADGYSSRTVANYFSTSHTTILRVYRKHLVKMKELC